MATISHEIQERLEDRVNELDKTVTVIDTKLTTIDTTLTKVSNALYGNGKAGLLTEFKLLREDVNKHHAQVAELQRTKSGWLQWIVTAIIAIAGIIAAFLKG